MSPVRAGNAALAVAAGAAGAAGASPRSHGSRAAATHPARARFRACRQDSDRVTGSQGNRGGQLPGTRVVSPRRGTARGLGSVRARRSLPLPDRTVACSSCRPAGRAEARSAPVGWMTSVIPAASSDILPAAPIAAEADSPSTAVMNRYSAGQLHVEPARGVCFAAGVARSFDDWAPPGVIGRARPRISGLLWVTRGLH